MTVTRKKLIEVALPLDAINVACARDKGATFPGHPRRIHKWWSAKPLPAARAAILGSLLDDPGNDMPEEEASKARAQMLELLGAVCADPNDQLIHRLLTLGKFDASSQFPVVTDPFSGSGAIPFEAIRLGLLAEASDLNPVATTVTRAVAEYPQKFRAVGPFVANGTTAHGRSGLAADVAELASWMEREVLDRLGRFYPQDQAEAWISVPGGALPKPEL